MQKLVVCLNGNDQEISANTIAGLLTELNLLPTQVAVEQNGTVLFRQEFGNSAIKEGDRIEIIRVVAGG
jgi:thiamine biosynthesis protein ThiS